MTYSTNAPNFFSPHETQAPLSGQALEGVRWRRVAAIAIDLTLIFFLSAFLYIFLGIVTLTIAWWILPPLMPILAFFYNGWTVSGWRQATPGMRAMDLIMRTENGEPVSFLRASIHAILFYATTVVTFFLLAVSFFSAEKRCLHDMLSGVIITRRR